MALFDKKKTPAAEPAAEKTPTDIIREMRSQNYSNNQIVEYLQKQGLRSDEIFDAMNKAEAGTAGSPPQMEQMPSASFPSGPSFMPPMMEAGISKEQVEEISESIIDEKMEDFIKEFKKITDWKEATETRLAVIEQKIEDMSKNFESLHSGVLGKIEEYDKGITEVGTEIKALEKVFSKILPTLTENVSELSRITQKLKSK